MSSQDRFLSWERFNLILERGAPALVRVHGDPLADFFADPQSGRIGLRVRTEDRVALPRLPASIVATPVVVDTVHHVELAASNPLLYRPFYVLLQRVCDALQIERVTLAEAITRALREWQLLLTPENVLSEDQQLGLFGELLLLRGLQVVHGADTALESWVGTSGAAHDFRRGALELEVKTTSRERRVHEINGLTQLSSSPGCNLFLLSLQLAEAGPEGGTSLRDLVAEIRALVAAEAAVAQKLEETLAARGYADIHSDHYVTHWKLRSLPTLIPSDHAQLPRLTIANAESPEARLRLRGVRYAIDCDGLGDVQGSEAFRRVLPIEL